MNVLSGRVVATILDNNTYPEIFKANGEWASIGGIVFETVETPFPGENLEGRLFALPLFANYKNFPVKNEIVTLIMSSNTGINTNTNKFSYYYLPPTNIFSNNQHNAIPQEIFFGQGLQTTQKKDYQQIEAGSISRLTDNSTKVEFDNGFKEKKDIRPLTPFAGDIIIEGRWGNSIRLGSTIKTDLTNPWSNVGNEGDAVTLIVNGQTTSSNAPWIPGTEDINNDKASIYLTSTQKIPIKVGNFRVNSFTDSPPINPGDYSKNQIILNSGRLLFCSNDDSILLTSNKNVHISSNSFNVDSDLTVIQSSQIKLGSSDSTILHPIAKGDRVADLLDDLILLVKKLTVACSLAANGSGPILSLQNFATENQSLILKLNTNLIKSKDVFTT